jgi:hypothetical protein
MRYHIIYIAHAQSTTKDTRSLRSYAVHAMGTASVLELARKYQLKRRDM